MFIYEFKSKNTSITKIVISGSYITFYTKKENAHELYILNDQLKSRGGFFAEHPSHVFCHHPFIEFSAKGSSVSHKHYEFLPNTDRVTSLNKIFDLLLDRQNNPSLREQDYNDFFNSLEEERKARNDTCFPPKVQNAIDSYDRRTPFVPAEEVECFLNSFKQYINNAHNMSIEAIAIHADEFLHHHWQVVYTKDIIGMGEEKLTPSETHICEYYTSLCELRKLLLFLEIDKNKGRTDLYYAASDIIKKIMKNSNYDAYSPFSKQLNYIRNHISNKLQHDSFLKGGMVSATLFVAFLYFWHEEKDLSKALLLTLVTGTTTLVISNAKPITNAIGHLFFKEKEKPARIHPAITIDLPDAFVLPLKKTS